jgi:sigma-B regulation protein RsbU (phosphoserine phosphatase)
LLVAFFTLGVIGVLSKRSGGDVEQFLPEYITELAGQERVKRELEIAHQVQGSFLPRRMPQIAGLDIAGMCLPATEVGGDYFDFIKVGSTRLAFVVGDVSGKGIEAAFYMTFVKGVIQTLSKSIFSPAEVMRRTNSVFRENAPPGTFISMIYGVVDVETGMFTFSRAGHNPAILKRHNAPDALPLQPRGMAIGFTDGKVFDESIEEVAIQLHSGDSLVFYTDGFSEAMNSARELYGDERLVQKVAHVGNKSSGAILRSLTEDVHHFIESAGRSDDMTMVVIKMVEK